MSSNWLEYRLYYHSEQDAVLVSCVLPLLKSLDEENLLGGFFFLRYWNGGPHLRLRFCTSIKDRETTAEVVEAHLSDFLREAPSSSSLTEKIYFSLAARLADLERTPMLPLAGDNILNRVTYVPEDTKYGGIGGIAVAHKLFNQSSRLCLAQLSRWQRNKRKKLGGAIVALLIALREFFPDRHSMGEFLEAYHQYWRGHEIAKNAESWHRGFEHAETALARLGPAIIEENYCPPGLEAWKNSLMEAAKHIRADPSISDTLLRSVGIKGDAALYFLLMNYMHTHLNRLGLLPMDEAYVAQITQLVVASWSKCIAPTRAQSR